MLHIHTLPGGPLPLLCSLAHTGVALPHPPRTLHTQTHTLSYGIAIVNQRYSLQVNAVLGYDRTVFVASSALTLSNLEAATRAVVSPASHDRCID